MINGNCDRGKTIRQILENAVYELRNEHIKIVECLKFRGRSGLAKSDLVLKLVDGSYVGI